VVIENEQFYLKKWDFQLFKLSPAQLPGASLSN